MRARLRLAVCIGVVAAAVPAVAEAKPLVHERYSGEFDELIFDDTCGPAIEVAHHAEFDGLFILRPPKRAGVIPLAMDNYSGVDTYTNTANGVTATLVHQGLFKETSITSDGDLIHVVNQETGRPIVAFGPDGERLLFDAGRIRTQFTIDTKGTEDPSDDEFFFEGSEFAGPHPVASGEADFCDLLDLLR